MCRVAADRSFYEATEGIRVDNGGDRRIPCDRIDIILLRTVGRVL